MNCKAKYPILQINGKVREREREKKNINDLGFQYVRSMGHLIKADVIKHQYQLIYN